MYVPSKISVLTNDEIDLAQISCLSSLLFPENENHLLNEFLRLLNDLE